MEIKKSEQASLENKKSEFLLLGLVVALGFLYIAFEWTKFDVKKLEVAQEEVVLDDEEMTEITIQQETPPPPPPEPAAQQPIVNPEIKVVENTVDTGDKTIAGSEDTGGKVEDLPLPTGNDEETPDDDPVFLKVEKQASFEGGMGAMMKWLSNHINYPSICAESGIEGKVFVQFTVKKDGSITDVQVVRGAHELLNAEAVRVVASMPKWKPGEQQGQKVSSKFTLPVVFKLQ
ncbi:MAG: energy transducer TonB [Paludibacteraceae bacterium]|nr:energy transducer TonB [Paludibacteraceae bacterium]